MAEEIDVGMKCIKYMLFVANFMFVMIGFLLISIGSTIKAIYGDFETFMEAHYFSPATLAVAIGVIIFFVALFGCVGAIKESTCLINLFAFFLTLLLILEIAAAVAAYVMRGQIEETIRKKMEYSIEDYYVDVYDRKAWNFAQSRMLGIIFAWMLAKAVRRLKTQELIDQDQNRQRIYEQLARGKDENPTPVLYTPTFSEA
ncbi:CD63 antigen [Asbolus verrucosus]|uniref:CD63 antigen n=1 Tax=Asbolus verrucosus TaxID=1661398 RepID=A0A482W8S0_ASBVE|nr:CD63 antigen [Asbolus verrucosus]